MVASKVTLHFLYPGIMSRTRTKACSTSQLGFQLKAPKFAYIMSIWLCCAQNTLQTLKL